MSAKRDKNQQVTFLFENLYKIYQDSKNSQRIIKAEDAHAQDQVKPYEPVEMLPRKKLPERMVQTDQELDGLRTNLEKLKDLQSKLRFMLNELDELLKK